MSDLIQKIEKFMEAHELSEWQFGELAMNDRHFVRQLRDGRDLRVSTLGRIHNFMDTFGRASSSA